METSVTDRQLDALGEILLRQGHCDQRTLERARRVAIESDQRLDSVLIQLGLVAERGLAEAYANLLSIPLATADRYPTVDPVLPDCLSAAFLRHARAMPVAADRQTV
ncbi:MAG TPA: type II secretion system protein GspE, partial [Rhodopila sp.]